MTAMATAAVAIDTLADLLEYLGGIHPNRVRFRPAPGTATEKDAAQQQAALLNQVTVKFARKANRFRFRRWLSYASFQQHAPNLIRKCWSASIPER